MADAPTFIADRVVHQTIHGYRHGHQLLATSSELDDETASVLAHNSDSAPNTRTADGNYLTGYDLPDGRYVIARTWNDTEAERPNTVVTRSFIFPQTVPTDFSVQRVLDQLQRPSSGELQERLPLISFKNLVGHAIKLTPDEASTAAMYYQSKFPLQCDEGRSRDRIAIAIWEQFWMPARYSFRFCTAPETKRFLQHNGALRFGRGYAADFSIDLITAHSSPIAADLQNPGRFRAFVHFVGSGEKALTLMELFEQAFILLEETRPPVEALTRLLENYRATEPRRLRRMKRRFLGFYRDRPRWDVDPFDLLGALASGALGTFVFASDASIDRWLRRCWDRDPEATARLLPEGETIHEASTKPQRASDGIALAFATHASNLITPETLALATTLNPGAAMAAVWDRNESALWRAWSELDRAVAVPDRESPTEGYDWSTPVAALRAKPGRLSQFLRRYPEALDTLIVLANTSSAYSDHQLDLTAEARQYIRSRLETPDPYLIGLARLSDPDTLPRSLDSTAWRTLLSGSKDEAVTSTAYLIARAGGPGLWEVATLATASLYQILASEKATEAWSRLDPRIAGDRRSWDRCGRLIDDYSHVLRKFPDSTKSQALSLLKKQNEDSAKALAARLRPPKSKGFSLFDPSTW